MQSLVQTVKLFRILELDNHNKNQDQAFAKKELGFVTLTKVKTINEFIKKHLKAKNLMPNWYGAFAF